MKTYAWALLIPLLFWGCRKDEPVPSYSSKLQLTVRATWNGQPFDKNTIYLNVLDQRIKVSQLKFYLSGLRLIGNGSKVLFDADLFDVTNGPLTRSYTLGNATYDSVAVGLGLPYDLNHAEPVLFPVDHPLGAGSGMLWNWVETFHRFVIFDGRYDSDPQDTDLPNFQFSIHTGRDECFRQKSMAHTVKMTGGSTTDLVLEIDVARFFTNEDGTIHFDLSQGSQSHGAVTELPQALLLSDMMIGAISVH